MQPRHQFEVLHAWKPGQNKNTTRTQRENFPPEANFGIPSVQSYDKGDHLIHVNIWTPKSVTNEEKAMLEKMR
ncbi:MAG: hypothetical protein IPI90_15760 [Saprospiraceae bacterium]|nr:hypothetical protein [Candidatus Vicinibacter affinis]